MYRNDSEPNPNPNHKRTIEEEEDEIWTGQKSRAIEEEETRTDQKSKSKSKSKEEASKPKPERPMVADLAFFESTEYDPDDPRHACPRVKSPEPQLVVHFKNRPKGDKLDTFHLQSEPADRPKPVIKLLKKEEVDFSYPHSRWEPKASYLCDICNGTDHGSTWCPCWTEIPPGVKVNEEEFAVICGCGMVIKGGICARDVCSKPTPDHVVNKEYARSMFNDIWDSYEKK